MKQYEEAMKDPRGPGPIAAAEPGHAEPGHDEEDGRAQGVPLPPTLPSPFLTHDCTSLPDLSDFGGSPT